MGKIAWAPGQPGEPPAGGRVSWRLAPADDGRTGVTQTYGWTAVTHPAEVSRLPVVRADGVDGSLTRLTAAAWGGVSSPCCPGYHCCVRQSWVSPPSTASSMPVVYVASKARNAAALANSSTVP